MSLHQHLLIVRVLNSHVVNSPVCTALLSAIGGWWCHVVDDWWMSHLVYTAKHALGTRWNFQTPDRTCCRSCCARVRGMSALWHWRSLWCSAHSETACCHRKLPNGARRFVLIPTILGNCCSDTSYHPISAVYANSNATRGCVRNRMFCHRNHMHTSSVSSAFSYVAPNY